jgi:hypothetical protein
MAAALSAATLAELCEVRTQLEYGRAIASTSELSGVSSAT